MGIVDYDTTLAPLPQANVPQPRPKGANDGSILGAAFRTENPVVAGYNLLTRPEFPGDENYSFQTKLDATPGSIEFSRELARANSDAEFDFIWQNIQEEQKDKALLMASGASGVGASLLAGILTPTILLPGGQLRAGASVTGTALRTASWAALGVGLDEVLLQGDQELRTEDETIFGIGSGFVFGGLLGGGFQYLTKSAQKRIEADMVGEPDTITVQADMHASPVPDDGISAQRSTTPDDEFLSAGGTLAVPIAGFDVVQAQNFLSPVTRTLNQNYSDSAKWMQAQLSTGGMFLEGNAVGRVGAAGGELQELVKQHHGKFYRVKQKEKTLIESFLKDFGESSFRFKFGIGTNFTEQDWNIRVGRAIMNPQAESIPQIQATAKVYRDEVYLPMLEEAQAVGLLGDISIEEAMTYFPRNVKKGMATSEWNDLQGILTEHIEETLVNRFSRRVQTLQEQLAARQEEVDLITTADPAAARTALETEMANLPNQFDESIQDTVNQIRDLRAQAKVSDRELAKQLRQQAKDIQAQNKDALKAFNKAERRIKQKFRALDQSRAGFEKTQQRTLDQINRVEDQQINTTLRAAKAVQRVVDKMSKMSDDVLDAEVEKLQTRIDRAFGVWARGEDKLDKLKDIPEGYEELVNSDLRPTETISKLEDRQAIRAEGLSELETRLNNLENLDRESLRNELLDLQRSLAEASNKVNNKRAARLQKLQERAAALSPERQAEIAGEAQRKIRDRRVQFLNNASESGLKLTAKMDTSGNDFLEGGADLLDNISFREKAEADADDITNTLAGNDHSFSITTLIEKRGPELARTLNIDPDRVWSNGRSYGEFVETDAEKVARRYVRSMGADIELMKRFRTVNPMMADSRIRAQIRQDFNEQRKAVKGAKDEAKQLERISKTEDQVMRDLNAQIERLRHHRGIPENPNGLLHRAGRVALNLNTVRLMGGVVLSSIPDLARPVFTYGLLNTFKDGFKTLVTDLQSFKRVGEEMRYAGTGLDMALHGRSAAMFDIFDEMEHGTMFERGLQWTTNNFGRIALFDQWNTAMKMFNANIANAYLMNSMAKMMDGTASTREIAFLAKSGIDGDTANLIIKELENGGGDNVNGTWLPNTEVWTNRFARDSYRAALAKNIDDNILTPNLERPLFADGNMFGRLVFQFRSFTFSSVQKIQIAAMQDLRLGHTAPVVTGSMISLALGAMSYYTWAAGRGGQSWEDAKNASLAKVADEAISRSGLLGVMSEVQRMADTVPGVPSLTLSGKDLERSPFRGATSNIAGPTYGLLENTIGPNSILMTASDPNARTIKKVRQLMPYNNIPVLSQAFTMAERGAANLLGVE